MIYPHPLLPPVCDILDFIAIAANILVLYLEKKLFSVEMSR